MKKLIAFTHISGDEQWKATADGLRENLRQFDIELVIDVGDTAPAHNAIDLHLQYSLRDAAFLDFSRSETRKILYLDAEVRMHKPLPAYWQDDISVVFYNRGRDFKQTGADGSSYVFPINTGQGIWNRQGIEAYNKGVDACLQNIDGLGFYDEEAYISQFLTFEHVKSYIAMDRIKDEGCEASRGLWVTDNTIFTHPSLHNISIYYNNSNSIGIPNITSEYFIAHYSPDDLSSALALRNFMLCYGMMEKLPFEPETAFELANKPPANLPQGLSRRSDPCYVYKDWIFCPSLRLLSPSHIWPNLCWNMVDN